MDHDPILGRVIELDGTAARIYTRTVVLWAVGLVLDPAQLWDHVAVAEDTSAAPPGSGPVVRMMTTATDRRGCLPKRLRSSQTFRSVLSMDIEHRGYMPARVPAR